jgi:hypothetical protein
MMTKVRRLLSSWPLHRFGERSVERFILGIEWEVREYRVVFDDAAISPASANADGHAICAKRMLLGEFSASGRIDRYRGWVLDPHTRQRWHARLDRSDTDAFELTLSVCGGLHVQRFRLRRVIDTPLSSASTCE